MVSQSAIHCSIVTGVMTVIKLTNSHQSWITTIPPRDNLEALRTLASIARLQSNVLPRSDHRWLREHLVTASEARSPKTSSQRRNDQVEETKEKTSATLQLLCVSTVVEPHFFSSLKIYKAYEGWLTFLVVFVRRDARPGRKRKRREGRRGRGALWGEKVSKQFLISPLFLSTTYEVTPDITSIVSGTSSPEVDTWYVSRIGFYVARGMKEGTEHLQYIPFRASGP